MLGLPYEHLAPHLRDYLEVLAASFDGPTLVEVDNDRYHVRNPLDITNIAQPVLIAALGPAMLRLAGERTDGTILWLADERAMAVSTSSSAQRQTGTPATIRGAGRPAASAAALIRGATWEPIARSSASQRMVPSVRSPARRSIAGPSAAMSTGCAMFVMSSGLRTW